MNTIIAFIVNLTLVLIYCFQQKNKSQYVPWGSNEHAFMATYNRLRLMIN